MLESETTWSTVERNTRTGAVTRGSIRSVSLNILFSWCAAATGVRA